MRYRVQSYNPSSGSAVFWSRDLDACAAECARLRAGNTDEGVQFYDVQEFVPRNFVENLATLFSIRRWRNVASDTRLSALAAR